MALLLDFAYLPGMPGVTVELAIFGLMIILLCIACCAMYLIVTVWLPFPDAVVFVIVGPLCLFW